MSVTFLDAALGRERDVSERAPLPVRLMGTPFVPMGAHLEATAGTVPFRLAPPAGATRLLLQAEGGALRFTLDGSAPGAARGFRLLPGEPPLLLAIPEEVTLRVAGAEPGASLQLQWGRAGA
jgi:hypothetical protein